MVLYNSNYKLVGMSKDILLMFGFISFGGFYANHDDISEFFIKEDGYFYPKGESFLPELLKQKSVRDTKVLLNTPNSQSEAYIFASEIFGINQNEKMYEVDIIKISNVNVAIKSKVTNRLNDTNEYKNEFDMEIPSIFKQEYKKELEYMQKQNSNNEQNIKDGKMSVEWFENTAKNLELSKNSFSKFLTVFVSGAKEKEEALYESLLSGNKEISSSILDYIKDPASVLDLRQVIGILYELENSPVSEIASKFREYQNIINQLEKIATQRKNYEV
ncbi:MAG: hypothetical protein MR902_03175 [Campylobacter sp.]|nr:hypothetical protein [Campylobacter sp.]